MGDGRELPTLASTADLAHAPALRPSRQSLIEMTGIGRRDPKTEAWLIRDVSFAVNSGDRLGILGPSGAGKTVLLRALAMLDPLDSGAIHWKGQASGAKQCRPTADR